MKKTYIKVFAAIIVIIAIAGGVYFNRGNEATSIGVIIPLTGPAQFFGQELKSGMDLANQEEGISLKYEDSMSDVKSGISAYNKLKSSGSINSVIVALSGVAGGVIPLAEKDKLPVIQTIVSAKKISNSPYSFRYFTSAEQEGPIMAEVAFNKLSLRKVATLVTQDEYGRAYATAFKDTFTKLGGEVVVGEEFDKKDQDYKTQLTKIKSYNPEAIYFIGLDQHLSVVFKQAKDLNINSKMLTNWVMASPAVQAKIGKYSEGVYMTTPKYYIEDSEKVKNFMQKYEKQYGRAPSAYAAIGYDLVKIMKKSLDGGADLLASLKAVKDVDGLMGNLSSDASGEITFKLYPAQIVNGKMVEVK